MFIQISIEVLKQVYRDHPKTTLYCSSNPLILMIFWKRLKALYELIEQAGHAKHHAVDFGGGNGVFLPSLARLFERVTCVDLDTKRASQMAEVFHLKNVKILSGDINEKLGLEEPADAIVAADVLEHFQNLAQPVSSITRWLKHDGSLYTSLPTENYFYTVLRKLFHVTKPADHYHSGFEVEQFLSRHGFRLLKRQYLPLRLFPLFIISAWEKTATGF
jgi:2-polyprenyl-3-methyl-5-hydroxy-6-metoxy-1,4-benzoquinol methylase